LAEEFYKEFWKKFQINSSYRSYAYQAGIKARGCPDNLCAKAWYSEHQSGLGFDIFAIETNAYWKNNAKLWSYYEWLEIHAHKYWFTNTYQKGLEIDWYEIEPWHWRYVWADLARYLSENNMTIAEFYYSQKKND
jgi:D-alanyl-D-alanine carboxypeptidase